MVERAAAALAAALDGFRLDEDFGEDVVILSVVRGEIADDELAGIFDGEVIVV